MMVMEMYEQALDEKMMKSGNDSNPDPGRIKAPARCDTVYSILYIILCTRSVFLQ